MAFQLKSLNYEITIIHNNYEGDNLIWKSGEAQDSAMNNVLGLSEPIEISTLLSNITCPQNQIKEITPGVMW